MSKWLALLLLEKRCGGHSDCRRMHSLVSAGLSSQLMCESCGDSIATRLEVERVGRQMECQECYADGGHYLGRYCVHLAKPYQTPPLFARKVSFTFSSCRSWRIVVTRLLVIPRYPGSRF